MKKNSSISLISALILSFTILISCVSEKMMDGSSKMFQDYSALEKALSLVSSHPNDGFNTRLNRFMSEYGWNLDLTDIPDGIYEAYSVPDKYFYVHYLRFEVEEQSFKNVYYNEYLLNDIYVTQFENGGSDGKRNDESYYRQMVRYGNDVKLWDAYPVMERELLETQNPMEIDGITGASLSVNRLRILMMKALYEYRNNVIVNEKAYSLEDKVAFSF